MDQEPENVVRLYNPTQALIRVSVVLDGAVVATNVEVPPGQEVLVPHFWLRRNGPLDVFDRAVVAGTVALLAFQILRDCLGYAAEGRVGMALWAGVATAYLWHLMRGAWRATR